MGIIGLFLMPVLDILSAVIGIYFKIVAVDIILYWMLHYKIMTVHNKYAEKFMAILKKLTEPVYKLIGKKIPPVSGVDISPYILLVLIFIIGSVLTNLSLWFHTYL